MTWRDLYEEYVKREFRHFRELKDGIVFDTPLEEAKQSPYLDYAVSRNDEEIVYAITLEFPEIKIKHQ